MSRVVEIGLGVAWAGLVRAGSAGVFLVEALLPDAELRRAEGVAVAVGAGAAGAEGGAMDAAVAGAGDGSAARTGAGGASGLAAGGGVAGGGPCLGQASAMPAKSASVSAPPTQNRDR